MFTLGGFFALSLATDSSVPLPEGFNTSLAFQSVSGNFKVYEAAAACDGPVK